jgi:hypothetical protein
MANNSFNIVGLDFDDAKASLKAYLQSQDTLKDYNFDGSVLSTVLDVLAYNTHYQAFYANMVANEMFLDSAVLRPSVVSHAKALGYVPSSRRASKAVLGASAAGASESTYLARGTEFIGTNDAGTQYRFVLLDTVYANAAKQSFENMSVYEGTLRRMSYIYDPSKKTSSVLLIPNDKIDTNTIKVRVKASVTDNTGLEEAWTYASSYIDLTPASKVYFLQEKETGMYELYFGDNFLGARPAAGSVVIVEYLETNGDAANGISRFTSAVSGLSNITAASVSSGGSPEESVSRIKFLAPKYYTAQGRAVTQNDYTAAVMKDYPNADSVYVYGGETTTPPQYGKVFIAVKPKSGSALTQDEKGTLTRSLKNNRSVVTVTPEVVDPDYIDLVMESVVTYDPRLTSVGVGTIKALVVAYTFTYSTTTLEKFGSGFHLSKLVQGINNLNSSIISNETKIKMRKTVSFDRIANIKGFFVDFRNPISQCSDGSVVSSSFSHKNSTGTTKTVYAKDDGLGVLNLVSKDSSGKETVEYPSIGKVDYQKGLVSFSTAFSPQSSGLFMSLTVEPQNKDLYVFENRIFRISRAYSDSVSVTVVTETSRKASL